MLIIAGKQARLEQAIRAIVAELGEQVTRDLQGIKSVADLSDRVKTLREQVERLEIEKGRKEEEFAKREREVEHKVGLERKRQEFELSAARREAVVSVREENLRADRERFEGQMAFHEKRFSEEVGYLKDMVANVLARLPDVTVAGEVKRGRAR